MGSDRAGGSIVGSSASRGAGLDAVYPNLLALLALAALFVYVKPWRSRRQLS